MANTSDPVLQAPRWTRAATPKLAGYASLGALGLVAGVAFGRVELVSGRGAVSARARARARARRLARADGRLLDSTATGRSRVTCFPRRSHSGLRTAVERLEIAIAAPGGVAIEGDTSFGLSLAAGEKRTLDMPLRSPAGASTGSGAWASRPSIGSACSSSSRSCRRLARCASIRGRSVSARSFGRTRRNRTSGTSSRGQKAEGIEFADLRPYTRGDRVRRVNWRATARSGQLIVNEQHPERNSATVLMLDSFADARLGEEGTLDLAVRAAAGLAETYVSRRDQVGLLSFGGSVNWLEPAMGSHQLYRIVEAILDTEVVLSYVWRDIRVIPVRALPPQALVVASDAAARRSDGGCADRRPRPRRRHRGRRDHAGPVRRRGALRRRPARVPDLAAAPRRTPQPLPASRRSARALAPGRPARARRGGGDGIQALRQGDARVAAGALSVTGALLLAVLARATADDVPRLAGYVALAGVGCLLAGLLLRRAAPCSGRSRAHRRRLRHLARRQGARSGSTACRRGLPARRGACVLGARAGGVRPHRAAGRR